MPGSNSAVIDAEAPPAQKTPPYSVSLSADGSTVAIGAPYSDGNGNDAGHVRIYQRNSSTNETEQLGADIDGELLRHRPSPSPSPMTPAAPPTQAIALTVTAVDDSAVVESGSSGSGAEDSTITGTSLPLTLKASPMAPSSIATGNEPTNGTASINSETGKWSHTPTANFYGTDSFTVTITDDAGTTSQAIVQTITNVDDAATGTLAITGATGSGPTNAQQGDILSATFSDLMDADGAVESTTYQGNPATMTASILD